jgi:uncharacterized LabA/DUF88 family protein
MMGSYFTFAQRHFYFDRRLGCSISSPFMISSRATCAQEQGYTHYRAVYGAWLRMYSARQADEKQLRRDRQLYHDLMHAGIDPKFMPMPQSGYIARRADVALAIDAMQVALEGKIDIAVLVTGDGDFVPLVRAIMKQGIRPWRLTLNTSTVSTRVSSTSDCSMSAITLNVNDGKEQGLQDRSKDYPKTRREGRRATVTFGNGGRLTLRCTGRGCAAWIPG